MKVCLSINKNIQSGSRNILSLPGMSSTWKEYSLPPWPNRTHGHSGKQHPSGILEVK